MPVMLFMALCLVFSVASNMLFWPVFWLACVCLGVSAVCGIVTILLMNAEDRREP